MSSDIVISLLLHYKYLIMLALMIMEWPIVSFISAFLASQWVFSFATVYILSVIGDVIGDTGLFYMGRLVAYLEIKISDSTKSEPVKKISRLGLRILIKAKAFKENSVSQFLYHQVEKRFFLTLCIVKLTPFISAPGHMFFGFSRKISFPRFLVQTAFLCALYESIFLNLGYFSGISIKTFENKLNTTTSITLAIIISGCALYLWFLIIKQIRKITKIQQKTKFLDPKQS